VTQETLNLLAKAESAIRAAQILVDSEATEFAAGRAYYAMLYVAEALLHERGLRFSKHSGVHAAYGKEFAKTGLLDLKFHGWILRAFDKRIEGDYRSDANLSDEEVTTMIGQAREFLTAARRFLEEAESPPTAS